MLFPPSYRMCDIINSLSDFHEQNVEIHCMTIAYLIESKLITNFFFCIFGSRGLCAFDNNTIMCDDNERLIVRHEKYIHKSTMNYNLNVLIE